MKISFANYTKWCKLYKMIYSLYYHISQTPNIYFHSNLWVHYFLPTGRYQQLQTEYLEVANTVQEQKALISQLEEDLRNVNALSAMFRGEGEGIESVPPTSEMVKEAVKDASTPGKGQS